MDNAPKPIISCSWNSYSGISNPFNAGNNLVQLIYLTHQFAMSQSIQNNSVDAVNLKKRN
jgi:hypothetical protein